MKALKEKRLSLRSLIRGGLVILSLFALVFAIGCNTSSDPDPEPGSPGNTDETGGTVAPTQPYVTGIIVQGIPNKPSFQGMKPVLDGVTVRVMWNNSQVPQFISGADLEKNGFYATGFCDIAGAGPDGEGNNKAGDGANKDELFYIAHNSSSVVSNGFKLPGVVALVPGSLNFTSSDLEWYADQRPNFDKLGLTGQYEYVVDKDGNVWKWESPTSDPIDLATEFVSADTPKIVAVTKPIPIMDGYPKMDITKVDKENRIKVGIQKSSGVPTPTPGSAKWIDNGPLFNAPAYSLTSGWEYEHVASGSIKKFYKIKEIKFNSPAGDFLAYDDENNLVLGAKSTEKIYDKVTSGKLKFDITYDDDKPARTITWDEYTSNLLYIYGKNKLDPTDVILMGGSITPPVGYIPTLLKGDDDENWNVIMKYVPKEYASSNFTYDGTVSVAIPLYEFQGITIDRKSSGNLQVLYNPVDVDISTLTSGDRDLLTAIKDKWKLTGTYERLGDSKTNAITFTAGMFNDAVVSGRGVRLWSPGMASQIATISNSATLSSAYSGKMTLLEQNFALPLRYRTERLTDEEETVVVDIYYQF